MSIAEALPFSGDGKGVIFWEISLGKLERSVSLTPDESLQLELMLNTFRGSYEYGRKFRNLGDKLFDSYRKSRINDRRPITNEISSEEMDMLQTLISIKRGGYDPVTGTYHPSGAR